MIKARWCLPVVYIAILLSGISCTNEEDKSFFKKQYNEEISALYQVAKKSNKYASNGSEWGYWKKDNSSLFDDENIIRAEVMQMSSDMSLLVKLKKYKRIFFFMRNIPDANETSVTKGYLIKKNNEKVEILEYLHGVKNKDGKLAVIRLIVAPKDSASVGR